MTDEEADAALDKLSKRMKIMNDQLEKVRESGADPNSVLTQPLRDAIESAAQEMGRIFATHFPK
jgi:hypothetical protein